MIDPPPNQPEVTVQGQSVAVKLLLFLFIIAVIGSLAWSVLHFLKPSNQIAANELYEQEKLERKLELGRTVISAQEREQALLDEKARLEAEAAIKIAAQKREEVIASALGDFQSAVDARDWQGAENSVGVLLDNEYDLAEVAKLNELLETYRNEEAENLIRVSELIESAKALDKGKFSSAAIAYLDEALTLMPGNEEASELREKIDAYTTIAKVPEEFASVDAALEELRGGDTILLAEGVYEMSVTLHKAVIIQGAGIGKTIIECDTKTASGLVFGKSAKTHRMSDLSVRGVGYDDESVERYPLISIESDANLDRVSVEKSASHGIVVISGTLSLKNSQISRCAWDGVSVKGPNSKLVIEDSKVMRNYDHGIDFWEGARGTVLRTEVKANAGSGIVVMGQGANVDIEQVQISANQQSGLVVNSRASVVLKKVFVSKNELSGVVIQGAGTTVVCEILVSNSNGEAGYFIDPASTVEGFQNVTAEGNKKGKLVSAAFESE